MFASICVGKGNKYGSAGLSKLWVGLAPKLQVELGQNVDFDKNSGKAPGYRKALSIVQGLLSAPDIVRDQW